MSRRESDDDYSAVVCRLNERWRVIECRDGIQWILQHAEKKPHGRAWRGRSYCRTREALIRVCGAHAGEMRAEAAAVLDGLPERLG